MAKTHDQSISFNEKTFVQFVKLYYKCLRKKQEQFEFMGHTFLTAYAKYVIEYLEPQMVAVSKWPGSTWHKSVQLNIVGIEKV